MAAFSFGLGATLEFIINEPDVNILLASIVGWPLISLGLYYALYRAKLFYFGDVQYAAVLGLVCLARAGPLEYLFAQMVSLSAVLVALGIQYLTAKRLQITCPDRQLLPSNDFIPVNALVGSVEIRAGPYLLLGHSVAALMVIG